MGRVRPGRAVARIADFVGPDRIVADVLLDQRVAAGIGYVFKSEVLWACRLHPASPIGVVPAAQQRELFETAAGQLHANLTTSRRTTVPGPPGSLAAYRRARRPCLRCGVGIRSAMLGEHQRSTYWCPRCQERPVAAGRRLAVLRPSGDSTSAPPT